MKIKITYLKLFLIAIVVMPTICLGQIKERVLAVTFPDTLNTNKYNYELEVRNSDLWIYPSTGLKPKHNGEACYFQVHTRTYKQFEEPEVNVVLKINKRYQRSYNYYPMSQSVKMDKDTVYFKMPPLESEEEIDLFLTNQNNKLFQRVLVVTCPELLDTKKYTHKLAARNRFSINPFFGHEPKHDGQVCNFVLKPNIFGVFDDTLVNVEFSIRKSNKPGYYYYHWNESVNMVKDTIYLEIPPFESKEKIELDLKNQYKGKAFSYFINSFESNFIYVSYYQGYKPFGEILYAPSRFQEGARRIPFKRSMLYYENIWSFTFGSEFNFKWNRDAFILGPKIGTQYSTKFINYGLHAVYYTDFNKGVICLKPRIGFNPNTPYVNISYAYGIRLGPNYFGREINTHQLCLNFIIPLKRVDF